MSTGSTINKLNHSESGLNVPANEFPIKYTKIKLISISDAHKTFV